MKLVVFSIGLIFSALLQEPVKYINEEAGFTIDFPSPPQETETMKEGNPSYKIKASSGNANFAVYAKVNMGNIDHILGGTEQSLQAFCEAYSGVTESRSNFTMSGKTGIEAKISAQDSAKVNYRVIIIGKVHFQLMIISRNVFAPDSVVNRFFDSFKITENIK